MSPSFVILCPLEFEAARARRAAGADARVIVCGPGAVRAGGAAERAAHDGAGVVILFGTCGGLREIDPCPIIRSVVDENGGQWAVPGANAGARLLSVEAPLDTPEAKRSARERFDADLVDCEAAAFAAACGRCGVAWNIVRGVSDAWNESLPDGVTGWVTPEGRTRFGRAALECVARPSLIPRVAALSRRSGAALRLAADRLRDMIDASKAGPR